MKQILNNGYVASNLEEANEALETYAKTLNIDLKQAVVAPIEPFDKPTLFLFESIYSKAGVYLGHTTLPFEVLMSRVKVVLEAILFG